MEILKKSLPNFLGGLAVIVIVSVFGWLWSQYSIDEVDASLITAPKDGASVNHMTQFSGTYAGSDAEKDLWLVVQPVQSPQYHPQTSEIPKTTNKKWKSVAYIGKAQTHNVGEEFIVHLVSTSELASSNFKTYLRDAATNKDWSGIDTLPQEANVLHSISVVRK